MEIALQWKKFLLVGIAVAALAAYVTPFNELLGLNAANASIDQSIKQNNDGCSGDCSNEAGNYGSTSDEDVDIDQDIEQSNSDCEGTCTNTGTNNAVVGGSSEAGGFNEDGEYESYDGNNNKKEDNDVDQSIKQNNDGCSGDCSNEASNNAEVNTEQDIEQTNEGDEGDASAQDNDEDEGDEGDASAQHKDKDKDESEVDQDIEQNNSECSGSCSNSGSNSATVGDDEE